MVGVSTLQLVELLHLPHEHPGLVYNADKGLPQDQAMALSDPKLVPDPVSMAGCKLAGKPSSERK